MISREYWNQKNIDTYSYSKVENNFNSKRKYLKDEVIANDTQEDVIEVEVKPKVEIEGKIMIKVIVDAKDSVLIVNNEETL